MDKKEHRTKGMRIDIDDYPEGDLISMTPGLRDIPSWRAYHGRVDRNRLCRYIIYIYSQDSYLNKIKLPLEERKKKALLHAGWKPNEKGEFDQETMSFVFHLNIPEIFDMIFDYLKWQNDNVWTEIIITETELDEANRIRLRPLEEEDKKGVDLKKALRENCKEMNTYLDQLWKRFANDHTDVKNRKRATTLESLAKNIIEV